MNAEDQRRAVRYGKQFAERLLKLPALARLSIEVETDPHGHIREKPRFNLSFLADEEPEKPSGV